MKMNNYDKISVTTLNVDEIIGLLNAKSMSCENLEVTFNPRPRLMEFQKIVTAIKEKCDLHKVFFSLEDAIIAGTLFNVNLARPRRAVIEVANGCNLKCDFCWTHSPLLETPPDSQWLKWTIKKDVVYKYIDDLERFKTVDLIEFCAIGDPLYHPEIWEFIEYSKQKGFRLRLSTNATLMYPDKWDKYCQEPINEMFMNISAGNREIYSDIHNVSPKVYDQLMKNLQHISGFKNKANGGIHMRWINIITDKNLSNIQQIVVTGLEHGADYFDFRYVWVHKSFQKNIGVSKINFDTNRKNLENTMNFIEKNKINSNFPSFFDALLK